MLIAAVLQTVLDVLLVHGAVNELPLDLYAGWGHVGDRFEDLRGEVEAPEAAFVALVDDVHEPRLLVPRRRALCVDARHLSAPPAVHGVIPLISV